MTGVASMRQATATPRPPPPSLGTLLQRCGGHPCPPAGCRHDDELARSATASGPAVAPAIVHEALASPGRPLDAGVRVDMERRFGHSFTAVRLHTDPRAADAAAAVAARAFTVGHDVVLAAGEYRPATAAGRQLLAHELTHVVQQARGAGGHGAPLRVGDPASPAEREAEANAAALTGPGPDRPLAAHAEDTAVARAWAPGGPAETCPRRAPGEPERARTAPLQVAHIETPERGVLVGGFGIGGSDTGGLAGDPVWAKLVSALTAGPSQYEILGFSDCQGSARSNTAIRTARARAVNDALPAAAKAKVTLVQGAPLQDCVGDNGTEQGRAANRSAVLRHRAAAAPPAAACPPATDAPATTLQDYQALVACAEATTGLGPRDMLALLRQLYYGRPWSFGSRTSFWDNVIPCSPDLGHPEARLGSNLFQALGRSQTVGGVDLGHLWTGLEAMTCPMPTVRLLGGLAVVQMPNEEFATWGGDLGAGVAAHVACTNLGADAATNGNCGRRAGPLPLAVYLNHHAPPDDLEADLDAFLLRAGLAGTACGGSAGTTLTLTRPLSHALFDYYLDATTKLGAARGDRARCLVQAIGGTISGTTITNRNALRGPIAFRVAEFAFTFYANIRGLPADVGDRTRMRVDGFEAADWFLDHLEGQL